MVKIQVELSSEEDKTVEIYKLINNLKTKQEAIKKIIRCFEVNISPKKLSKKSYYQK